jgi:hypothetical protein
MFFVDEELVITYKLSDCTIILSILRPLNDVVEYIYVDYIPLLFTAGSDV